jgi:aminopeptidase N
VAREEGGGDARWFTFERSPKMASYLFTFFIGQFSHIEIHSKRGIPVRGYTPLGRQEEARLSIQVAADAVDYYDDYF